MSFIYNIPFSNLTFQQGDTWYPSVAFWDIEPGKLTYWGSNWVKRDNGSYGPRTFMVGKLRISLLDTGIPEKIPASSLLKFNVKSADNWCGAGFLRAYISTEDLTLMQVSEYSNTTYKYGATDYIKNNNIGICQTDFTWSSAAAGKIIEFSGEITETIGTSESPYLYLYIMDSNYNTTTPGATISANLESYFSFSLEISYGLVEQPGNLMLNILGSTPPQDDDTGNVRVYQANQIKISFTAPEGGNENPLVGYKFWYKNSQSQTPITFEPQVKTSSLQAGDECEYSYYGFAQLQDQFRGKTYQIGVQAIGTQPGFDSSIAYSNFIEVVNCPPSLDIVPTGKIKNSTPQSEISFINNFEILPKWFSYYTLAIDWDFIDPSEKIEYFYAVTKSDTVVDSTWQELIQNRIKDNLKNNQPSIDSDQLKEITSLSWIKATPTVENEYETIKAVMDSVNNKLLCFAVDSMGEISEICASTVEINTPLLDSEILLDCEIDSSISSFDGKKKYVNLLKNIKCVLTASRKFSYNIQGFLGTFQNMQFSTQDSPANWNILSASNGYGDQLLFKIEVIDEYGDTFYKSISSDWWKPKDVELDKIDSILLKNNEEIETINGIQIADTYLHTQQNFYNIQTSFDETDIPLTVRLYLSTNQDLTANSLANDLYITEFSTNYNNSYSTKKVSLAKPLNDSNRYIKFSVSDVFGSSKIGISKNSNGQIKIYKILPTINVATFDFSVSEWSPLKDQNYLTFSTTYFDNSAEIGISYYKITDELNQVIAEKLYYNPAAGSQVLEGFRIEQSGQNISFSINSFELFKKLKTETALPDRTITFTIVGYNAYGAAGIPKATSCRLITRHAPYWSESTNMFTQINTGEKYSGIQFNPGETITFTLDDLTEPQSYNDTWWGWKNGIFTVENRKVITGYEIKALDDQGGVLSLKEVGFNISNNDSYPKIFSWTELPNFIGSDIIPKNVTFQIQPIAKFGSDILRGTSTICPKKTLMACRKATPQIRIERAAFDSTTGLLTPILMISDFGGNNRGLVNFERNQSEPNKEKIKIILYGNSSKEPQAQDQDKWAEQEWVNSYEKFQINSPFEDLKYNDSEDNKIAEGTSKIYLKVKIIVQTNSLGDSYSIESESPTYLFYLGSPTVSHRSHWVGINTIDVKEEEVFKISDFENRKNIVLIGTYLENNVPKETKITINLSSGEIVSENYKINLKTGELSGFTLSGGSW